LLEAVGKKSPELREQIAIHQLERTMRFLATNQEVGERTINWSRLGEFLNPSNPAKGAIENQRIRAIVGKEAYGELMDNLPRLEIVRKVNKERLQMQAGRGSAKAATSAAVGLSTGKSGAGQSTTASNFFDLLSQGYYGTASFIAAIPGARKAFNAGASIEDIVGKLGPQRAYIIMQNAPKDQRED
jgi:hypothetical protein